LTDANNLQLTTSHLGRQAHLAAVAAERRACVRAEIEEAECSFQPDLRLSGGSGGDCWRLSGGSGPAGGGSRFASPRGSDYDGGSDVVTKLAVQVNAGLGFRVYIHARIVLVCAGRATAEARRTEAHQVCSDRTS
jgi:hypothetical protein